MFNVQQTWPFHVSESHRWITLSSALTWSCLGLGSSLPFWRLMFEGNQVLKLVLKLQSWRWHWEYWEYCLVQPRYRPYYLKDFGCVIWCEKLWSMSSAFKSVVKGGMWCWSERCEGHALNIIECIGITARIGTGRDHLWKLRFGNNFSCEEIDNEVKPGYLAARQRVLVLKVHMKIEWLALSCHWFRARWHTDTTCKEQEEQLETTQLQKLLLKSVFFQRIRWEVDEGRWR